MMREWYHYLCTAYSLYVGNVPGTIAIAGCSEHVLEEARTDFLVFAESGECVTNLRTFPNR